MITPLVILDPGTIGGYRAYQRQNDAAGLEWRALLNGVEMLLFGQTGLEPVLQVHPEESKNHQSCCGAAIRLVFGLCSVWLPAPP